MSFDSLPIDILTKIFHQLPFEDRVRLGNVNQLFSHASQKSISKMKSLVVNDHLMNYSVAIQSFPSLLESCSSTLESIDAANLSYTNKLLLKIMADFVFPKLEHLDISIIDAGQTKKMVSQNRNLRSVILRLHHRFDWPEDIVFVKLEKLEIHPGDYSQASMLAPLVGNVPNLKRLTIKTGLDRSGKQERFMLSVQEINQFLASTPYLEELNLDLRGLLTNLCQNFIAAIPNWHLQSLTRLAIDFPSKYLAKHPSTSSSLHSILILFPQLKSFASNMINKINDQALSALTQLEYFQELRLPQLAMTKGMFIKMITSIPSIAILEIKTLPRADQVLQTLSQLENLRELYLHERMTKDELVCLITNIPLIAILEIDGISDAFSSHAFMNFVTSTAALFHQNLVIRFGCYFIRGYWTELDQMKVALEEMENNGGPVVEMKRNDFDKQYIGAIQYKSLMG